MTREQISPFLRTVFLCILAAGANFGLSTLLVHVLKVPLFVDTLFTAAVSFTAGLLPGLLTALLTQTATGIREGSVTPFVLCSIAEVVLVCRFNPVSTYKRRQSDNLTTIRQERAIASWVSIFAGLFLLYIVACIAISVLGGLIDFVYHSVLSNPKQYFSAEDTFKIGLLRSSIPVLATDILSRIPVNLVDRFIVIFGGYFISRGLIRLTR